MPPRGQRRQHPVGQGTPGRGQHVRADQRAGGFLGGRLRAGELGLASPRIHEPRLYPAHPSPEPGHSEVRVAALKERRGGARIISPRSVVEVAVPVADQRGDVFRSGENEMVKFVIERFGHGGRIGREAQGDGAPGPAGGGADQPARRRLLQRDECFDGGGDPRRHRPVVADEEPPGRLDL